MLRTIHQLLIAILALALAACGNAPPERPPTHQSQPATEQAPATATQQSRTLSTPGPVVSPEPLFYNLPPATLSLPTGLYASPNRSELIVPVEIPAGTIVYVMGRNGTGSHLRVVWSTGVGWIPVSFTDYNNAMDKLRSLPIFTREPPRCAEPITTQFALNSAWTSNKKQRIGVVVDLFRSQYGEFPPSFLSLTLNDAEVSSTRRQIIEKGQFSLKDVVFSLPGYVQQGDVVGYRLDTASNEPLTFMATIFSVPEGCQWDTK